MKVLILSTYFHPDVAATGIVLSQIAARLSSYGNNVTVIASVPHYDSNRIWREYRGRILYRDEWNGVSVSRLYTYVARNKQSFVGRVLGYVCFTSLSGIFGLGLGRPDIIVSASPPLTIGLSADFLSRVFRVPFVYNVQDVWPDVVVRAGQLKNPSLIRLFQKMERYIYRRAAAVTVLSDQMRQNLLEKGVSPQKVHVIPTCQDTDFIRPINKKNEFSRTNGLVDRFVILFAGNVGHSQGLETVLEAAKRIENEIGIRFLIVGNGVAKPGLEEYAQTLELNNTTFLPYQPHERVPEVYASADVCLVPLKKGFTTESVPSKVHTIMAAAKPIVASVDPGSATSDLIETADCGICVELENPSAMAEAIMRLYRHEQLRKRLGQNGREYVVQHFTPEIVAKQYDELFKKVVAEHKRR